MFNPSCAKALTSHLRRLHGQYLRHHTPHSGDRVDIALQILRAATRLMNGMQYTLPRVELLIERQRRQTWRCDTIARAAWWCHTRAKPCSSSEASVPKVLPVSSSTRSTWHLVYSDSSMIRLCSRYHRLRSVLEFAMNTVNARGLSFSLS